jgi:HD superfamily phosphohydrolase YqeK
MKEECMEPKQEFLEILDRTIKRDGAWDLSEWLANTDFFVAPASTRYHGAYEGGLVKHSLSVYHHLVKLCKVYECDASDESVAIVALFHDICKIGCYKTEMRWRKNKLNQWEQYPTYKFEEDFKYGGHGSKSVYLLQNFIALEPEEAVAINCHMGQWDSTTYSNPTTAFETYKLAWLLHIADEAASFLDHI